MQERNRSFTLKFSAAEWEKINRLAEYTDRPRGAVIRRLVDYAAQLPEARHLLGIDEQEAQHESKPT